MHAVSEPIGDITYDAARAKLFIRFRDGDRYVYVGVPGEVCRSFMDAESKAAFFVRSIRDCYPYNKLGA